MTERTSKSPKESAEFTNAKMELILSEIENLFAKHKVSILESIHIITTFLVSTCYMYNIPKGLVIDFISVLFKQFEKYFSKLKH